jgi:glycosyltransferase involved in cell wall biosynthesis
MRILLDLQACQASSMNRGIGRYSLALAQAIARNCGPHDVRIALSGAFPDSASALRTLFGNLVPAASISTFMVPLPSAEGDPGNRWRVRAAELMREHHLACLRPDVVHIASLFEGLGDSSVSSILHGAGRFDTAVTLYDLIPLMRKERYLDDPNTAAWYYRKLDSLRKAELLLAISDSARAEGLDLLGLAPEKIVNISSAADTIFAPRALAPQVRADLLGRFGLHRSFIMYTGGVDYRKNVEALMEAYAVLPGELRRQYQLAIVCGVHDPDRMRLRRLAAKLQLADDDVILTGFVSDDDLISLYNCTALFVFPSLHEGFGLPVLEAMACGAPVIGSQTSSIPEVIGRADAIFDPASVPAISTAMVRVLGNPAFADELRAHGLRRAPLFSWDASAQRAIAAFEQLYAQRNAVRHTTVAVAPTGTRPRLAFVSPLPPVRSGVADYSAILVPELARFYAIDLVLAQPGLDASWPDEAYPQRTVEWFDENAHLFDRIVYQFGNSSFHAHMFGLLERHPGVVVMHDFFLSGVLHHTDASSPLPNYYSRSQYLSHGYRPLVEEQALGRIDSYETYPGNQAVLDRATGVIFHSHHALALARRWYGPDTPYDWRILPLLSKAPSSIDRDGARQALGLDADAFLLCTFGNVAQTKCADEILDAWLGSAAAQDARCQLVFVGQAGEDDFGIALRARIAAHVRIHLTGYTTESTYHRYLAAADAAVQLRAGSRGETSGAILNCLAYGVPTIINAHGSAAELPGDAFMLLDDAFTVDAARAAMDMLHTNPALRARLAAGARAAILAHAPARYGQLQHNAIEAFTRDGQGAVEQRLVHALAAPASPGPSDNDLRQTAAAIAINRQRGGARQVLIDVTALAQDKGAPALRTLIAGLVADAAPRWRIEPIRHDGKRYRYARRFTLDLLGLQHILIEDAVANARNGDILLTNEIKPSAALLPEWQARGVVQQRVDPGDDGLLPRLLSQLNA